MVSFGVTVLTHTTIEGWWTARRRVILVTYSSEATPSSISSPSSGGGAWLRRRIDLALLSRESYPSRSPILVQGVHLTKRLPSDLASCCLQYGCWYFFLTKAVISVLASSYYADVIFDEANLKDTYKLQTLQNKCLRICTGKDRRFDTNRAHKLANEPFLRAIPTRRFTTTPTRRRATAVAERRVSGEISNMHDISWRSPFAQRWQSPGDQLPSCPINMPYPLGNQRYNRP